MSQKPFPTDKASLEKYEKRVQNFTFGRLEKEWEIVKDDPTPERRDIVAKELREWEKMRNEANHDFTKYMLLLYCVGGVCATEYLYLFVGIIKRILGAPPQPEITFTDYLPYYPYSCAIVCLAFCIYFVWNEKNKNFINKIKEFGHTVITEAISVFLTANGLVGLIFGSYYGFFVTPGPIVSRIISGIIIILSVFYFYNHLADKYKGILFKNSIPLLLISLALEQIGRLTIL
jgi:hypothetical protein